MHSLALAVAIAASPALWAEPQAFIVDTEATAIADTQAKACEQAFILAEEDARTQIDNHFPDEAEAPHIELRSRSDVRLGAVDGGFDCRVIGSWAAIPTGTSAPMEDTPALLGNVETIEGRYKAGCIGTDNGAACRRQIEREAAEELKDDLVRHHDLNPGDFQLEADGFEGSQSFRYEGRNLTLTMDGTFYFKVKEPTITSTRPPEPTGTEGEISVKSEKKRDHDDFTDNLDFTLFYNWDGNDSAKSDELALSTNRWGVGLWVNNRFGFSAFWGDEKVGIADSRGDVHSDPERYSVQGIGIGYRVFDNRAVTLENMLHYVDAEPYSAFVDPGCSNCTGRNYEAEDYYQASINLKTNTEGLNIGWMLTWKLRDDLTSYDSLSGGWYLELQF